MNGKKLSECPGGLPAAGSKLKETGASHRVDSYDCSRAAVSGNCNHNFRKTRLITSNSTTC